MIVILKPEATEDQISHILDKAKEMGLRTNVSRGTERTVIGFIGPEDALRVIPLEIWPGIEKVIPVLAPYKLVSREFRKEDSVIKIKDIEVGGNQLVIMAGPCSVENKESLLRTARALKRSGAASLVLRGGAFKPRTSPYDFQGLGEDGLKILKEVSEETGLPTVSEVMDPRDVEVSAQYIDVFQIGARNMQNFSLLKEVGKTQKPVLLKRGMSATIKDLLMSAEYIMANGNFNVILCERGIRTFETATRNTFDINAIPVVKQMSHLPIIADPSHGTGRWGLVGSVAGAAVAAGCDGLMIEVHEKPEEAFSDGPQSLTLENFVSLIRKIQAVARAVGKNI